jgi:hypothetical protein
MAYDRYDTRDERSRWRDDDRFRERERGWRGEDRGRGGRQERGFFERAGDEVASWFGDEDAERRRREDQMRDQQAEGSSGGGWVSRDRDYDRGYGRDWNRDRNLGSTGSHERNQGHSAFSSDEGRYGRGQQDWDSDRSHGQHRDQNWNENRGMFARGGSSERDYYRGWRDEFSRQGRLGEPNRERDRWVEENNRDFGRRSAERGSGDYGRRESFREPDEDMRRDYRREHDFERGRSESGRGYRPMTGDYGRSSEFDRGQSNWARDPYRETSRAGTANKSDRSREDRFDPHYRSWRDRHLSELDRDYDDYRAEHQSKFESDFGSWRERREQKRGLLGQVREHMEVVGNDGKHVGTVDKPSGDRLILTKSDPESGGAHHSISCSDIDRVEGDKVILDCSADEARHRWRDESRGRALFEGEDQGEMGPRILDRSFEGTYR